LIDVSFGTIGVNAKYENTIKIPDITNEIIAIAIKISLRYFVVVLKATDLN